MVLLTEQLPAELALLFWIAVVYLVQKWPFKKRTKSK